MRLKDGMKLQIPKQNSKHPNDFHYFLAELKPEWKYLTTYYIDYNRGLFGVQGPNYENIIHNYFAESDLIPYEEQEYRILNDDEILQEGDEYLHPLTEEWRPTKQKGRTKLSLNNVLQYRRKINNEPIKEIKMKQFTKPYTIVKNIPIETRKLIAPIIEAKGINGTFWIDSGAPNIYYMKSDNSMSTTSVTENHDEYEYVELGDFLEMVINYKAPKKPVELTGIVPDYTIKITSDFIQVGCQEISYENFDRLVKAVEDFKKD